MIPRRTILENTCNTGKLQLHCEIKAGQFCTKTSEFSEYQYGVINIKFIQVSELKHLKPRFYTLPMESVHR